MHEPFEHPERDANPDTIKVDFPGAFAKARQAYEDTKDPHGTKGLAEGTRYNVDFKVNYYTEIALGVLKNYLAKTRAQGFEFTEEYIKRIARVCAMHIVYPDFLSLHSALKREFTTDLEEYILWPKRGEEVICFKPVNRADIVHALNESVLQLSRIEDDQFQQLSPRLHAYQPHEQGGDESSTFTPASLPLIKVRDKLHNTLALIGYKPTPILIKLTGAPEHTEELIEVRCNYADLREAANSGARLELESTDRPGVFIETYIKSESNGTNPPNLHIYLDTSDLSGANNGSSAQIIIVGYGSHEVTFLTSDSFERMTLKDLGTRWKFYKKVWQN